MIQAGEQANRKAMFDPSTGLQVGPRYIFEEVKPEADQAAQLLSLSDQIRKGELFLVLDISPDALRPSGDPKQELVRYYTNSGGVVDQLSLWLPAAVNDGLRRVRLAQLGVDPARVPGVLGEVSVVSMNLVSRDPVTGKIVQGPKEKSDSGRGCTVFPGLSVDHGRAHRLGAPTWARLRKIKCSAYSKCC